jgi:hypothetical protein
MQVSPMPPGDSSPSESSWIVRLVGFGFKVVCTYGGMTGDWKARVAVVGIGWTVFDVVMHANSGGWRGDRLGICEVGRE